MNNENLSLEEMLEVLEDRYAGGLDNEWMEGFIESILETPKDRLTIYQIRKIEEVYYQLLDK